MDKTELRRVLKRHRDYVRGVGGGQRGDLRLQDLSGLKFDRLALTDIILSGTRLEGCSFRGANLEGADLYGADLAGADLRGATLIKANLEHTSMVGTDLVLDWAAGYLFGREVWVQDDGRGGWRLHRNVHNALAAFAQGNPMLAFYIDACRRVMERVSGGVPPQIVGTKLLTALHNMIGLPLTDAVAMFSPAVVADLAGCGGPALDRLCAEQPGPIAAANLCSSLVGDGGGAESVSSDVAMAAVERLLAEGLPSGAGPGND